jgi:hypothetical protein
VFLFLRSWSVGDHAAALGLLDPPHPDAGDLAWTPDDLKAALEAYGVEHGPVRFDPEARNLRHTHVSDADEPRAWLIQQILVDPEMHNDWVAEFDVDLDESRKAGQAAVRLRRLGSLV